jgi:aryl-alcohol dehydrogenase-like predicted oxidoreductase
MRTVSFGESGLKVSAVCLGAMRFGTETSEAMSVQILDAYVETGGSFIDTANVYAAWAPGGKGGESESVLGRWMKARGQRDKLTIATKLGSKFQEGGLGLRAHQIEAECERSLKRLQTDRLDVYYAHFDDRQTPLEETMEAFAKLVKAGKVRYLAASNFRVWRLEAARQLCGRMGWPGYCAVQQRFSYFQPVVGHRFGNQIATNEDLLEYCAVYGLALCAYSPLLGGCYSRSDKPVPVAYANPQNEARQKILDEVAEAHRVTASQVVLAWMLHLRQPTVIPLVGASSVGQLRENLEALNVKLSADDMRKLNLEPV